MTSISPVLQGGSVAQFTLDFDSDWHLGSGSGRSGSVDASVVRDRNGLPYVPGTSMRGVLRHAAETIALGLDGGKPDSWCEWVEWLFGSQPSLSRTDAPHSPTSGALRVGAARLSPDAAAFLMRAHLSDAIVSIRPGVQIDTETGTARPDFLRMLEVAPADTRLIGTIRPVTDIPQTGLALLVAAASMVRAIGAKRRRGLGRCRLHLDGFQLEDAVAVLREDASTRPPASAVTARLRSIERHGSDPSANADSQGQVDGYPVMWRLRIVAEDPIVIADRVVGNAVRLADRIPASMLIPMIQRGLPARPLWPYLTGGSLSVGDGRLAQPDGDDALAPPIRSLSESKVIDQNGSRRLINRLSEPTTPGRHLPTHAGLRSVGRQLLVAQPERTVRMHNVIDDSQQRPTEDVGGLFSYDSYDAGTTWVAEVITSDPKLDDLIGGAVGRHSIGRATRAGYGTVRVELIDTTRFTRVDSDEQVDAFDVVLTSDFLGLDDSLRSDPTPTSFASYLSHAVGKPLSVAGVVAATSRREGWNRRWVRPRPTLSALAAGSVVQFSVGEPIARSALDRLGTLGVGERCAEGFGRFTVDPPELRCVEVADEKTQTSPPAAPGPGTKPPDPMCANVEHRALVNEARRTAERAALHDSSKSHLLGLEIGSSNRLTSSQLGALRQAVQGTTWATRLGLWVEGVCNTPRRRDKWDSALLELLQSLAEDPNRIWQSIEVVGPWSEQARASAASEVVPLVIAEQLRLIQAELGDGQPVKANHVAATASSEAQR